MDTETEHLATVPSVAVWAQRPVMNGVLSHTLQETKPGRPRSHSSPDESVTSRPESEGHPQATRVQAPMMVLSLKRVPPSARTAAVWWDPACP